MPHPPIFQTLRDIAPTISVGLLTADMLSVGSELGVLERTGVQLAHVDVMDGCFVPMMTLGPPWIRALKSRLLKDVHLMIQEPLTKVADYVAAGADMVTVHVESGPHIHRVLQSMGRMANINDGTRGLIRGVALNPGTPVETLDPLIDELELILLLAVNPGWGGQSFIPSTLRKLQKVRRMLADHQREVLVGIDGGVTKSNIADVAAAGADIIITGSAVFDGRAAEENALFMLSAVEPYRKRR